MLRYRNLGGPKELEMHVTWSVYDHSPRIDQAAMHLAALTGGTPDEAVELMKERALQTRRTVEQVAADVIGEPVPGSDFPQSGRSSEGAQSWE